jgi:hypothetical protein
VILDLPVNHTRTRTVVVASRAGGELADWYVHPTSRKVPAVADGDR